MGRDKTSKIFFWVVPAPVAGLWHTHLALSGGGRDYDIALAPKFQVIEGTVAIDGRTIKLSDARLSGDRLSVAFDAEVNGIALRHDFRGRVMGSAIEGSVRVSGSGTNNQLRFSARREDDAAPAGRSGAGPVK